MDYKIAALFVEKNGCYFGLGDVEPWDQSRDATRYAGPYAVIAHPPCQLWGPLANVNFSRYGGDHNRPGNDGGLFVSALSAVLEWGGVLEHPANTRAWETYGLTKPKGPGWNPNEFGGWTCCVWQSAYGHRAAKATWLFVGSIEKPPELDWSRRPGTHAIGIRDGERGKRKMNKREASATPPAFREALMMLARFSALDRAVSRD